MTVMLVLTVWPLLLRCVLGDVILYMEPVKEASGDIYSWLGG